VIIAIFTQLQLNDSYTTPRPHIRLGLTVNFGHSLASR
jgi:hypothetical protein